MIVSLTRQARFSAGHRYYRPEWSEAENLRRFGACSRPNGHGHDYMVEATVTGDLDPALGMVVNIVEVKAALAEAVEPLDGAFLDASHPLFRETIPTTENLARILWSRIDARAGGRCELTEVRVCESPSLWCAYRGEEEPVTLTRRYEFSAAHRLHAEALSDDRNRALFGKCNNPRGHGHNYGVEVTVAGEVDPATGMAADLARLDEVVERLVIDRMDHRHLNFDVPEFAGLNPTSENLAVVVWNLLRPEIGEALIRIGIRETDRNYFEYTGR